MGRNTHCRKTWNGFEREEFRQSVRWRCGNLRLESKRWNDLSGKSRCVECMKQCLGCWRWKVSRWIRVYKECEASTPAPGRIKGEGFRRVILLLERGKNG